MLHYPFFRYFDHYYYLRRDRCQCLLQQSLLSQDGLLTFTGWKDESSDLEHINLNGGATSSTWFGLMEEYRLPRSTFAGHCH